MRHCSPYVTLSCLTLPTTLLILKLIIAINYIFFKPFHGKLSRRKASYVYIQSILMSDILVFRIFVYDILRMAYMAFLALFLLFCLTHILDICEPIQIQYIRSTITFAFMLLPIKKQFGQYWRYQPNTENVCPKQQQLSQLRQHQQLSSFLPILSYSVCLYYDIIIKMLKKAIQSYKSLGYGLIPNFLNNNECSSVLIQIGNIIENFNPKPEQVVIFNSKHDEYKKHHFYLSSVDQIRCFLQENTYKDGKFLVPKNQAVSKIGHALHERNMVFRKITYKKIIKEICQQCGMDDPLVVQSMCILKPSKVGAKVVVHQDSTFLYDEPTSLIGFWIPFQDTTLENGCLWALPKSHKNGLYLRASMDWQRKQSNMLTLKQVDYKEQDFIPIPMKKGQLIFFSGTLLHKSQANVSQKPRYAYTWHIKESKNKWPEDNWVQRKEFPKFQYLYE